MTTLHHDAVVVDCHNDLLLLVARKRALGETRLTLAGIAAVREMDRLGILVDLSHLYPQYPAFMIDGLDAKATIEGLTGPRDLGVLTDALLRRRMPEADVRKVLGGNFMRVFRSVPGIPRSGPGVLGRG